MSITHHLDDATLMSFAAGGLPDALSAVAAAHVAMCPRCRAEMADLELVGGALMAELAPASLDRAQPAAPHPSFVRPVPHRDAGAPQGELPGPVARLVRSGLGAVAWRWLGPGVWDHPLPVKGTGKLRLLRVAPRHGVPEHGHGGTELTLVLRGSFRDQLGRYFPGDVAERDETMDHHPVINAGGDCICLVGSEAPEQFRGRIFRHWQRLRRI
jgi:putative transcriptional regulator